jgi:polysaccharide biosynthesis/export protein
LRGLSDTEEFRGQGVFMGYRNTIWLSLVLLPLSATSRGQQPRKQVAADLRPISMAAPSSYVIGPADVLDVTVWKEPSLSGSMPVRPDGKISLALLGDVPAADLTPIQLATNITQGLKKYIQDPSVYVVVAAVNSQRIFLLGEVQRVGPVSLSATMTPLQAIASAGGLTPYANTKHIYILRSESNKQITIPFNYKRALKGTNSQDTTLLSGDTIVVP